MACADGAKDSSSLISAPNGAEEQVSSAPTLSYINAYSDKVSYAVGEVATITAVGVYSDGTSSDISNLASFSSSDDSIVAMSSNQATAIAAGVAHISASLDGVSRTITLVPFSATITGIELNYTSLSLPSDGQAALIVNAIYDNGQSVNVTAQSTFTSSDDTIATVSASGVIDSQAAGSINITVDYNGHTKLLPVNITAASIDSIQISPIVGSKPLGGAQQFYATASLSDGTTLDITNFATWSSSDTSIMTITSSGEAALISAGSASITADYQGISNSVNFQVLSATVDSISLSLSAASLSVGINGQATLIANYSDGSTEDVTDQASFSVSDVSIAMVSESSGVEGQINTLAIGSSDITASFGGQSATQSLTVSGANLVSISVTTNNSLLSSGINAYFTAMGTYDDATVVDITDNVTWSLSTGAHGSISNSSSNKGLFTNNFSGGSTTSLTVSATMGAINGDLAILLAPGTISSISINPSSATMNTSQNVDFKAYAHFSDGASVEITDIVTWTSSDNSITMVSNGKVDAGRVSSITQGSSNIQASYNGMSSSSSAITVDDGQAPETPEEGDGLTASYFTGNNFNTLTGTRIDAQINYNWATGMAPLGVGDSFSVRWTGKIKGKVTGDCQISSRSDDGFRIWIGGNSIIDVWFPHAPRWDHNYSVSFVEGVKQDITVEFFENGGYAVAELYWQCPGDASLDPIPTEFLFSE